MKRLVLIMLTILMLLSFIGCGHKHEWTNATCVSPPICEVCGDVQEGATALGHDWLEASCSFPKKCSRCDLTEGEVLPHSFVDATCEKAKTCDECGEVEGEPLGHNVKKWQTIKKASCKDKGSEEGKCSTCKQTVTKEIDLADHKSGDWKIKSYPTSVSDGVKVKECKVCGKELEEKTFKLTIGQRNALKEAQQYIDIMAFSKPGLIDQLEYEGYEKDDIDFAVENIDVDWNEECLEDAEQYLEIMSFSKEGLIDQLEYEGYTDAQIRYAVEKVGY